MLQISNQCIFFFISYYFHIILVYLSLGKKLFLLEKIDAMKNMGFGPSDFSLRFRVIDSQV
jgi:hypothetical protein